MKIGIVGSRHFDNYGQFLALIGPEIPHWRVEIVSGGAYGVDTMAKQYAEYMHHLFTEHPVPKRKMTRAEFIVEAYKRNQLIVDELGPDDMLIALPCQHSKGTHDTIKRAEKKGVKVLLKEVDCGRII